MPRDPMRVLDAVLDGVVVLDDAARVELVNAEASRLLDASSERLQGAGLQRALSERHPLVTLVGEVLASGRSAVVNELRLAHRFSGATLVDASVSPLFAEGGGRDARPDGVVLVLRDRTIQKSLEAQVSERERLTSFGQIAAGIAHEVKNPLGGIRGAAEIIGARAADAKSRDAAELVVREVDRITALVDEFMVFARGEDPRLSPVNIHRVLDDVLDLMDLDPIAAGVETVRAFDPSIPELPGDADRLAQVFLNLVRNALQAMEGGPGTLTITTRVALDHRLSDPSGRPLPTLLVCIEDTGPGVPAALLEQLSTPFFTTRPEGTGLGLAVSRHWIALHGGTLRIASEPGRGAAVQVTLPLRQPDSGGEPS